MRAVNCTASRGIIVSLIEGLGLAGPRSCFPLDEFMLIITVSLRCLADDMAIYGHMDII